MPASVIQYRLSINGAPSTLFPEGFPGVVVISSVPSDAKPYIAAPPSGDGQEVDPLTGSVRTGSYTVEIVDANTGTDATGTIRVLTNKLEDATFRQQLLSRRAYVEARTDDGAWISLVAGYILGIRLISPMRYAVSIGNTRRVEQTQTIFQGASLGSYTTRGCLIGGPVTADWGPFKARGGWRYTWTNIGTNLWQATFQRGYSVTANAPMLTDWRKVLHPRAQQVVATYAQPNPYPSTGAAVTYDFAFTTLNESNVVTDGIVAYIGNSATNAVATNAVLVESSENAADNPLEGGDLFFYWPSCPYSSGTTVFLSLTTAVPNASCPLYLDAHPVDVVTAIWENARIDYDTSAAWIAATKALIGDNVRVAFRFIEPPLIAEFLEQSIFGPFGIAARTNSDGKQELFPTRIRTSIAPTLTLTATAMRGADEVIFDLDERTAVSAITLRQQVFQQAQATYEATPNGYQPADLNSIPLDGVNVQEIRQTSQYLDPYLTVFTGRAVEYALDGMIHAADNWTPASSDQLQAISVSVFDRFGRGCPSGEVSVLAGTAVSAANIGDELYVEAPHYPNKNYRIGESSVGARIMQVVRRTETPAGPVFKLLDSGLAAQPATLPTLSISAAPGSPTTTAQFTITNAATLNATGVISVRVEWASGASAPTGGADFATYAPAQIPTGAVVLPSLTTSGQTVWVRARSEQAGRRPSNWTAWSSVSLTALPIPSGVALSSVKQTAATVSWTNTSSTLPVVVFAYQGGSAPSSWTPYRVAVLPAGSTSTIVRTLTGPSIAWTIGVAYESSGILGAVVSATTTTTSTSDTPTRPAALAVIPGVDDASLTQGVALALWPADQSLNLLIERSGSATSGFGEIARVSGSTPVYVDERPRNGATWYYRIAHVLGGYTTSDYTPVVSAIAAGVPRDVVRPDAVGPVVQVVTSESGTTATVTLTITDPQNRVAVVRFRERTGGGAWSAWVVDSTVPYSYSGTIPATGFLDIEYEVRGYNAAGEYGLLAGGTESFDRNATADMISVVGTFTTTGGLTLALSADSDTASFKYAVSTTVQPTATTVRGETAINGRNYATTLAGPYAIGTTVYVSALAYTGASAAGAESALFEYRFTRGDSAITYLQCLAVADDTSTATQIVVTVTATAPSGTSGTPTVELVAVTGSATLASGSPAVGVPEPSGTQWTFDRGAALGEPGGAQFRAILAGTQSDDDFIEIPEQGRDTTYLASRARVIATSDTDVTVRYAVLDRYSPLSVTVTYQVLGLSSVTPASPQTVTAAVGTTFSVPETAGSYVDFTVPRPSASSPTGRITFTAANAARVADSDAVDVPSQTISPPSLNVVTTPGATTYSLVVTYSGTMTYQINGGTAVTGTGSPQTITATRPAAGSNPSVYAFKCVRDGITVSDSVSVPALEPVDVKITAFSMSFDYTNDYIEYNYTLTGLPTTYLINTYAVLDGVAQGAYPTVSSSTTQTIVGAPIPIDPSGTVAHAWQFWIEITDGGAQVLAMSVTEFATTYEP